MRGPRRAAQCVQELLHHVTLAMMGRRLVGEDQEFHIPSSGGLGDDQLVAFHPADPAGSILDAEPDL